MERLTAEDRLMLWPAEFWPQDIGALAVLDGARLLDPDGRFRVEAAQQAVEGRLHLVPRFRQVLHVPRHGLGGALWTDARRSTSPTMCEWLACRRPGTRLRCCA